MFGIPYHAVFDPLGNENVPDVTRSFYPSEQTEAPTSAARWCPASSVMGCQQWGLFQKQRWWMCEIFKPADVTWMTSLWEMDTDWLETFRKRSPIGWATWENQLGSPAHHVEQMVIKELVLVQDFTLGWCNNVALPHVLSTQHLSLLAHGWDCGPEQILAEQMVLRWKSQHFPNCLSTGWGRWLQECRLHFPGPLLGTQGDSFQFSLWTVGKILTALEEVCLDKLRKTKKLSEIENRRFALVGKRSEQYGGWSAGLAWLPLSGTVKEDRGKALPTLCPNLAQGLDIFGGHIPGCWLSAFTCCRQWLIPVPTITAVAFLPLPAPRPLPASFLPPPPFPPFWNNCA